MTQKRRLLRPVFRNLYKFHNKYGYYAPQWGFNYTMFLLRVFLKFKRELFWMTHNSL